MPQALLPLIPAGATLLNDRISVVKDGAQWTYFCGIHPVFVHPEEDRVTVNIEGESDQMEVVLQWAGGFTSCHHLVRPVSRYEQLADYPRLRNRIDALRAEGCSFATIAQRLNKEGFHPPKRTACFTGNMVTRLLSGRGLHGPRPSAMGNPELLQEHEYWLTDLARTLNVPVATLHRWQRVGWLHSRKVNVAGGRWAIWADADEIARLGRLRGYRRQWPEPRYPVDLTTPKPRGQTGEQGGAVAK